jgi:tRNA(fMet)-specific endonuclease VapC
MMRGYLLDTNIIAYWFDAQSPHHLPVVNRIDALAPDSLLAVSSITLGEIEYGHQYVSNGSPSPVQAELNDFVRSQLPMVLDVRESTSVYYGMLRTRLFRRYPKKNHKKYRWPEQIIDPATSLLLGIQENDLWLAAQALEHRLVLVTHDKMSRIQGVAPELQFEDWTR